MPVHDSLHVEEFAAKAVSALDVGVHLLLVDLFPPGPYDPHGMHGVLLQHLEKSDEPYDLPADEPLTLAAYAAGPQVDVYRWTGRQSHYDVLDPGGTRHVSSGFP